MKQCVIYKSDTSTAAEALKVLRRRGISAVQVDNPDPTFSWASKGTNRVRIAVPKDQASEARSILADWERSCAPRADRLARSFRKQAAASLAIAIAVMAAYRLLVDGTLAGIDWNIIPGVLFLWFITLVILANATRITGKGQR